MRIAVNTRFLLNDYLEGFGFFIHETFRRMVLAHPEHEFIFLFDRPYNSEFIYASNVTPVVIGPPARHPLLWKLWYDYKVPSVLRKYKADVFVSADGFVSLRTKVPQCVVVHDLSYLHFPSFIKKTHLYYLRSQTPKFLKKAKKIVTVSAYSKKDIVESFAVDENKISVVYNAVKDSYKPVTEELKEAVKAKYTQGREYFIYVGSIHPRKNLMNLLKAFSVFKKRMKSNMQLVIAGRLAWKFESFTEGLKTYKYRNDVHLLGYLPQQELAELTASAYDLVYPSLFEGFGVPPVEAMNCEVPVITSSVSSMPEICGDAALYADPENVEDIADKMMLLYKDEQLRSSLVEKGKQQAKMYSWDKSAQVFWQAIRATMEA